MKIGFVMTANNLTRKQFEDAICLRMVERTGDIYSNLKPVACETLEEMLSHECIEYGDPNYDWSQSGAFDIADEEMSYWSID